MQDPTAVQSKRIGTYQERPVYIRNMLSWDRPVPKESLANSVVAVIPETSWRKRPAEMDFLCSLIVRQPLAIAVYGEQAIFDDLVSLTNAGNSPEHIMTKWLHGTLTEAVEGFFYATWPSYERFDRWEQYDFFVMGDSKAVAIKDIIVAAINGFNVD